MLTIQMKHEELCIKTSPLNSISFYWLEGPNKHFVHIFSAIDLVQIGWFHQQILKFEKSQLYRYHWGQPLFNRNKLINIGVVFCVPYLKIKKYIWNIKSDN